MPTYAILGATGACGGAILKTLITSPSNTVHCYVRSSAKLERQNPEIFESPNVRVFEGPFQDVELISRCIEPTNAVFQTIASNDNIPGLRIAQDSAQVLVAALSLLRERQRDAKLPRVVVLSAAPVNHELSEGAPVAMDAILWRALGYIYGDLELAQNFLRLQEGWLSVTFVQPGGLNTTSASGYKLTLTGPISGGFLSYDDLAAAMVEIADTEGTYDGKGVGVIPRKHAGVRPGAFTDVLKGAVWWYLPWLYGFFQSRT
ncbi:hypothetical protein H2203_003546 [Taxawa tesnikishii (nom. ined.)]|nr:hypothetical protein H2203_003546 [Dothideales sp. JES 119]